ncbi:MAG: glycosyltransferase family 2 protein [Chlorobi bacterium]|nr:glycosyltransferase family 2 protein [Chlorobiota bacterium]
MDDSLILIPCHNCRKRLGQVLNECRLLDTDIMVVDDGSSDGSAHIPEMEHVRFAVVQEHKGVGHALQEGFRVARQKGYRSVITLDADGAHDPKDIPGMIEYKKQNGVTLVIGNRWHGDLSGLPGCKVSANRFAAGLVRFAGGVNLPDVACGLRVMDVSMTGYFDETDGFGFLYSMLFNVVQKGGTIGSCPVNVRYDASDLWFTKKRELLDLVGLCEKWCSNASVLEKLHRIGDRVRHPELFSVCFSHDSVIRERYVVHPLAAYDGFMFQEQHASFCDCVDQAVCFEEWSRTS